MVEFLEKIVPLFLIMLSLGIYFSLKIINMIKIAAVL